MNSHRIACVLAVGFFAVWLGVLYAEADHPPPSAFLWLVLLDAVAAWHIYMQVSAYIIRLFLQRTDCQEMTARLGAA